MIGVQNAKADVDYTSKMSAAQNDWNGAGGTWGGGVERYNGNDTQFPIGDVLYQTISDLPNGNYEISFYAFENFSNWNDKAEIAYGRNIAQAFANESRHDFNVIKNTGGREFNESTLHTMYVQVTNGTLKYGVKNVKAGGNWAVCKPVSLIYKGETLPQNTDLTSVISNWDFTDCANDDFLGWTIAKTGGNSWVHGSTAVEHWSNDLTRTFDYYQEISGLPEGRYTISASMWNTQGSGPNGNSGVYGTSNDVTAFAGVTDDCGDTDLHTYSTSIFVNNGGLRLGVKNNGTRSAFWFGVDWIKLNYEGKMVRDYAVALPAGGAMAADTWYYFDIASAANNYTATATALANIICTDDGNTLTSAATGNVTLTATDNSFAAKRYYVKSSSANNLEIGVASYTYTVSEASADKSYIQPSQTVTVNFTASTNDPDAVLSQNYSGVTFDGVAIDLVSDASGFHFTTPANLEAGVPHTLYIPAEAIGYADGDTYNAEQSIVLNATAVYDGIYFLKVAATYDGTSEGTSAAVGKYLARGLNYGTHATLDKYGLPVQITTNANNETTIQAYDTKRYFFHGNTYDCWADQTPLAESGKFTVTLNNGKLLIHNNSMAAGTYLKYNTSAAGNANIAVFDDGNGTNAGPIIMWTTETAAAHATVMQSYKDAQAATAAAAAYASGNYESLSSITTVSALEAELEAHYIKGDFVSPSAIESIQEKYQGGQPGAGNITETVYSNTINITEPGFYKFSMQAFYRAGSNPVTQDMHTRSVDFPPVVLFFGDSETQIKSVYDDGGLDQGIAEGYFETETVGGAPVQYNEKWYTNGQHNSVIIFQKDYYHNDVYFYASAPGTYEYGVKYMGWACANMQWFIYSPESVEITSYAAAADAADYTALQNAIDAFDDATWGFEKDEYAPYNNTTAIEKIADARAIDPDDDNSKLLVNSLTTALALSANAEEVNAVYNPTFALSDNGMTAVGWSTNDGSVIGNETSDSHSRAFVLTSGQDYDRLAALGQGDGVRSAFFTRYDGTNSSRTTQYIYGATSGYTMPLKAQKYRIAVDALGWNQDGSLKVALVNNEGSEINAQTETTNNVVTDASAQATHFVFIADVPSAGDYKFVLSNGNTSADYAVVVSNISIMTAPATVSVTLDGTTGYATFGSQYPLNLIPENLATGVKAYKATTVDGENITFEALEQGVPANTGLLIAGEPGQVVTIPVATSTSEVEGNLLHVNASGETFDAESGYSYYGLKKGTKEFRPFAPGTVAIPANKAYLRVENINPSRLVIRFDDLDPTAINAVEAAEANDGALKDGKYLIGNKVVLVKNGVKYGANGQKLN